MKKVKTLCFFLYFCFCTVTNLKAEEPYIYIHINFIIVRNFDNSIRSQVTEDNLNKMVKRMNELEEPFFRGYRFIRQQIQIVGGTEISGDNPSRWYNTDFFDTKKVGNSTQGHVWKDEMETAARISPNYSWSNFNINIYIINGICGGSCSFPEPNDYENIIVFGGCNLDSTNSYAPVLLHEIGHFFNLCHTQGCNNGDQEKSDNINDTPKDNSTWDLATIMGQNTTKTDDDISEDFARNSFDNIMSYHSPGAGTFIGASNRLTELQLDRWADAMDERKVNVPSNRTYNRTKVRSGSTRFVAPNAPNPTPITNQINYYPEYGNSYKPANLNFIVNVNQSILQNGDMILFRPGIYTFKGTIKKRVILRATRNGSAVIGR